MARIVSFERQQTSSKKNLNILKRAWRKYLSVDKFTKGAVLSFALIIVATPLIVREIQSLSENAAVPINAPPAIYFGVSADGAPDNMRPVYAFEKDAGKQVSIISFSESWNDHFNLFYPATMDNVRNHGAIPLLKWTLPVGGSYSYSSIINGSHDTYITKFAQEAKAWNHPFFLEYDPDSSCTWRNEPAVFIKAWQHVHDIFTQVGVTNATWVWSQQYNCANTLDDLSAVYPGDSYVDWVGMSGVNEETKQVSWQPFSDMFTKSYSQLQKLTPTKPMLVELASGEGQSATNSKAAWISDTYSIQIPHNFPQIKGVVWDQDAGTNNFSIETSQSATQAFAKAVLSTYYMNDVFDDLMQSPIPPIGEFTHPTDGPSAATPSASISPTNQ